MRNNSVINLGYGGSPTWPIRKTLLLPSKGTVKVTVRAADTMYELLRKHPKRRGELKTEWMRRIMRKHRENLEKQGELR